MGELTLICFAHVSYVELDPATTQSRVHMSRKVDHLIPTPSVFQRTSNLFLNGSATCKNRCTVVMEGNKRYGMLSLWARLRLSMSEHHRVGLE